MWRSSAVAHRRHDVFFLAHLDITNYQCDALASISLIRRTIVDPHQRQTPEEHDDTQRRLALHGLGKPLASRFIVASDNGDATAACPRVREGFRHAPAGPAQKHQQHHHTDPPRNGRAVRQRSQRRTLPIRI